MSCTGPARTTLRARAMTALVATKLLKEIAGMMVKTHR